MASSPNNEIALKFRFFQVYKDARVELFRPHSKKIPQSDDPVTGVQSKDVIISSEPPVSAQDLARLGCERMLIFVAEEDYLTAAAKNYYEKLNKSGWKGTTAKTPSAQRPLKLAMATDNSEITHDFPGFFKVYKDGRIERYWHTGFVEAGVDTETGLQTKDVVISLRDQRSPYGRTFKTLLSALVTQANVMAVSIDYRLAPEHKLPTAYDDSLAGLQWIATHSDGKGPEPWINEHADLGRVILAGANLAQEPDKFYQYMCPTSSGTDDDPKLNPEVVPDLLKLKCDAVLVCLAEKDKFKGRGVAYYEAMKKCGWGGTVYCHESKGEDHCFHFFNPGSENIGPLMKKMVDFIQLD
ncbi:ARYLACETAMIDE DEACETYLASE [Salix purpurea]|uniref:ARYLACETAMIDE DEACETYLASE n=1 Tax=Salix purpurea TaxID=77065 RepID=A0A9Q0PQK2_SALPP|nr:ARYLACETAMIDE DEACETYLASE [Salix purpurea]